jgi:hypothetical protein
MESIIELGPKFATISKKLPGRNENSVRNHYNSLVKKFAKDCASDSDLDMMILAGIKGEEMECNSSGQTIELFSPIIT